MKLSIRVVTCVAALSVCASLIACAPQAPVADTADGNAGSAVVAWSMNVDCAQCHETEGNSFTDMACLASTHEDNATCVSCHTDEAALAPVHESADASGKMPKKLKNSEVSDEACLVCHGSYEELAARTAKSETLLVDSQGTAVNPHEAPGLNADHEKGLSCVSCHVVHEDADSLQTAEKACSNCHHRGVYECGTCHE